MDRVGGKRRCARRGEPDRHVIANRNRLTPRPRLRHAHRVTGRQQGAAKLRRRSGATIRRQDDDAQFLAQESGHDVAQGLVETARADGGDRPPEARGPSDGGRFVVGDQDVVGGRVIRPIAALAAQPAKREGHRTEIAGAGES